jgi:vacuolar-type H+-ATPase subunit E/Vma4
MNVEPGPGALLGAIDQRAAEERARLLAEAEARVKEILAAADAECGRLKAAALAGLEKELAVEQVRLLGEARMRARTEGLTRRRALLQEAFRRADERIQRLKAGPGAAAALAAFAEEARQAVGEPCNVQASASDWQVSATSEDGRRRVENSPDGRLARARAAAEHGAARRLFGDAAGGGS